MAEWDRRWLLSGGIGSGKSEVRRLLEASGVTTIDADSIGHEVIAPGGPAHEEVAARWPEVLREGIVDRLALGSIVFGDIDELRALESFTHPHIFGMIDRRVEGISGSVVVELPVLSPNLEGLWRTIVVDAPDALRLERAVARGTSEERVRAVMTVQPTRAEWLSHADLVVPNHGDRAELTQTVASLVPVL